MKYTNDPYSEPFKFIKEPDGGIIGLGVFLLIFILLNALLFTGCVPEPVIEETRTERDIKEYIEQRFECVVSGGIDIFYDSVEGVYWFRSNNGVMTPIIDSDGKPVKDLFPDVDEEEFGR